MICLFSVLLPDPVLNSILAHFCVLIGTSYHRGRNPSLTTTAGGGSCGFVASFVTGCCEKIKTNKAETLARRNAGSRRGSRAESKPPETDRQPCRMSHPTDVYYVCGCSSNCAGTRARAGSRMVCNTDRSLPRRSDSRLRHQWSPAASDARRGRPYASFRAPRGYVRRLDVMGHEKKDGNDTMTRGNVNVFIQKIVTSAG